MESDEVIKSSVENLVQIPSESEGILDKMCDVPFREILRILDISKTIEWFLRFYLVSLEEVKDFHREDREIEDDILQNSSSSTTTRSDYSLPDYEAFYFDDDHIEEKSSGSSTTHSDISLLLL
ncbi:hypothetical protein Tco_0502698 [Tanacetum coccineum]